MERFDHEHCGSVFLNTTEIACFYLVHPGIMLIVLKSGFQVKIRWEGSAVDFAHAHFPKPLNLVS